MGKLEDLTKLLCSFVNPEAAKEAFTEAEEPVENVGFNEDLKKIDPNYDPDKYADMLEGD